MVTPLCDICACMFVLPSSLHLMLFISSFYCSFNINLLKWVNKKQIQHQSKVHELWMYLNNPVDLYTCNVKQFNALSSPNSITDHLLSNICMTDNLKKSFAWNLYKKISDFIKKQCLWTNNIGIDRQFLKSIFVCNLQ